MSKSKRSQQRHANSWRGQMRLDQFFAGPSNQSQQPVIDITAVSDTELDAIDSELIEDPSPLIPIIPQTRRTSERDTDSQSDAQSELPEVATRPPSSAAVSENGSLSEGDGDSDDDIEGSDSHIHGMNDEDAAEDWEHELDETIQCPPAEIKDWQVLRAQIKQDLKKRSKTLTLSALNQLMILSNFATLRLKGVSRIMASEEIA